MFQAFLLEHEDTPTDTDAGNTDFSGANAKRFVLAPEGDKAYRVHSLTLVISDDDSDYNKFGDLAALTNGIQFLIEKQKASKDPYTLRPLYRVNNGDAKAFKKTQDFLGVGEVQPLNSGAGATRSTRIFIAFPEDKPLILKGRHYERLAVLFRDDLTGLDSLEMTAIFTEEIYA